MKVNKLLILLLITSFAMSLFGQEVQSYSTADGSKFTIGDSITFGFPAGNREYQSVREYFYDNQYSKGYRPFKFDLTNYKVPINKIYRTTLVFGQDKVIIKAGEKGLIKPNYYIDIEQGVKNGEIIVKSAKKSSSSGTLLTKDLSFAYFHKLSKSELSKSRSEYLYRFKNDLYNSTREDEFKFQSSLKTSSEELNSFTRSLNTDTEYSILTLANLQQYDFEKEGFPFNEKELHIEMLEGVRAGLFNNSSESYPRLVLSFNNFVNFSFLLVNVDDAQKFINRRKSSSGSINREVYLKVFYKLKSSDENIEYRSLIGEISKIEVYEFKSFQGNFFGEIIDLTK